LYFVGSPCVFRGWGWFEDGASVLLPRAAYSLDILINHLRWQYGGSKDSKRLLRSLVVLFDDVLHVAWSWPSTFAVERCATRHDSLQFSGDSNFPRPLIHLGTKGLFQVFPLKQNKSKKKKIQILYGRCHLELMGHSIGLARQAEWWRDPLNACS
jgi:hypothetical protein